MRARPVRIGNSRGVRLPESVIEEARLADEVELRVQDGAILITGMGRPRAGWAQAARRLHARGDDRPLDPPTTTRLDAETWPWR